ncbi:MAG: energy transducer TonB [Bacteroidia bacterium]|nr:energy transducer TonB [Bacteroidia bacterium]
MEKGKKSRIGILELLATFIFVGFMLGPYMWRIALEPRTEAICSFPEGKTVRKCHQLSVVTGRVEDFFNPKFICGTKTPPPTLPIENKEALVEKPLGAIKEIEELPLLLTEEEDEYIVHPDSLENGYDLIKKSISEPIRYPILDQTPVPINMDEVIKQIKYPELAKEAGIQGTFACRVLIDKKGGYLRHIWISDVHAVWKKELENHIPKLRFLPAIQDGVPVKLWVNIPLHVCPIR